MATRNREAQQTPLTTRWQDRDPKGSAFTTTIPNERTTLQDNTMPYDKTTLVSQDKTYINNE